MKLIRCSAVSVDLRRKLGADAQLLAQRPLDALTNLSQTHMHDVVFGCPNVMTTELTQDIPLDVSYALAAGHLLQYALHEPAKLGLSSRLAEFIHHDKTLLKRLWLAAALLPYFGMQVKEKKKIVCAPAFIISNGLKVSAPYR